MLKHLFAICSIVLLSVYTTSPTVNDDDWFKRPGTVHVCLGDPADFIWKFKGSIESSRLYKKTTNPDEIVEIYGVNGDGINTFYVDGWSFRPNTTFRKEKTTISDAAQYDLDIYTNKTHADASSDSATLNVIKAIDCPDRYSYKHPKIEYRVQAGESENVKLDATWIYLPKMSKLELEVEIPPAKPPIICTVTTFKNYNEQHICHGAIGEKSMCTTPIYMADSKSIKVEVNLTYIAYENSSKTFYIKTKDDSSASTTVSDDSSASTTVIVLAVFLALCGSLSIMLFVYILYKCRTEHQRQSRGSVSHPPESSVVSSSASRALTKGSASHTPVSPDVSSSASHAGTREEEEEKEVPDENLQLLPTRQQEDTPANTVNYPSELTSCQQEDTPANTCNDSIRQPSREEEEEKEVPDENLPLLPTGQQEDTPANTGNDSSELTSCAEVEDS